MMLRSLLFSICCATLMNNLCNAQVQVYYTATLAGLATAAQLKSLSARMEALDSNGKWDYTEETGVLELCVRAGLTAEGLQAWVSDLGCTVTAFQQVPTPPVPASQNRHFAHPDFPVFLDTGDRIADDQRYELEKSVWIATHAEAYRELTAPAVLTTQPE